MQVVSRDNTISYVVFSGFAWFLVRRTSHVSRDSFIISSVGVSDVSSACSSPSVVTTVSDLSVYRAATDGGAGETGLTAV